MKRNYIAVLLILVLLLPGCGKSVMDNANIIVTDSEGAKIYMEHKPQRVAVLLSSFADIWLTAGGNVDVTVGESVERGFADDSVVLVDAGAGKTIDAEALIAAKPDFVIGSADIPAQCNVVTMCKDVGIPAGLFRVESFDDYLQVLKTFTQITGNDDNFIKYGTDLQSKIDTLVSAFQASGDTQRVLFIRSGSSARSMKAKSTKDHFACGMLKELGVINIADAAPILLDNLSTEQILLSDPDYILISTMGDEGAAKEYTQSVFSQPQWQALRAVRNNNVVYLPKELFQYKPNCRWADAYQQLISILTNE